MTFTVNTSTLGPLGDRYDADGNGSIERDEVIAAIRDYFNNLITRDDVIAVIRLYFSGGGGAPSNRSPSFADGAATTRSVAENTAAGQDIGAPLAAVDPDRGDTLTYTLGGTDAASFDIVAATGQLQTKAALDAATKSSYTVTVTATDTAGANDTITVTITVNTSTLGPLGDRYDANGNGSIERDEIIAAIRDYFNNLITRDDVIAVTRLYFTG